MSLSVIPKIVERDMFPIVPTKAPALSVTPAAVDSRIANFPQRLALGHSLMEQSCTLAAIAYQATKFASNKGARTITAVTAVACGASYMYSGNVVSGAAIGGIGAKELFNIVSDAMRDNGDRLTELLKNAGAGVEMVQTLEKANTHSFNIINTNIDAVQKGVKHLNELLTSVNKIAKDCSQAVADQKLKAQALSKESNALYNRAYGDLNLSRTNTEEANDLLQTNIESHKKLIKIVADGGKNCMENFFHIADAIGRRSIKIKECLDRGSIAMESGMQLLNDARAKAIEAEAAVSRAMDIAKNDLQMIVQKSQAQKLLESTVDVIQKELSSIQNRREDELQILEQIADDLEEAQEAANSCYDSFTLVVGGGLGSVVGNAIAGPIGAVVGVQVGAELMKNHKGIMRLIAKIYNFVFGKISSDFMPPVNVSPLINYQYFSSSTGAFGWAKGRQSWTKGEAHIKVGNEMVSYEFDLNAKRNKISEKDLVKLSQKLMSALDNNEITNIECNEIISRLETAVIGRGADKMSTIGFVQMNSPYFNEIKRRCNEMALA